MRYATLTLLLLGALAVPSAIRADHSLVLIVNAESSIERLNSIEIRKVYLGFSVSNGQGIPIRAIANKSSARLWEIFLQDVMGMSARSYDRRRLALTLQSGRLQPLVVEDLDQLLESVSNDRNTIAFAWEEDVKDNKGIRILRVLWRR
jgi:hypothetical protein